MSGPAKHEKKPPHAPRKQVARRKRCLTRRREGTKRKNWVSLRVLRGFARYGDGASREGAKARRGKTRAVFAFIAASRATGTVPHAKARRHEEEKLGQSSRSSRLRALRGRCLTRRREGTKRKNWVSLRVLRCFARYGNGASREGAKARREKAGQASCSSRLRARFST